MTQNIRMRNVSVGENEAGYVKAEFYTGSYEAEAWFDPQGNWMLTETDLPYNALPQTVKTVSRQAYTLNGR